MHIRLRYEGHVMVVTSLENTSVVGELKAEVEKLTGIPTSEQILAYNGRQLDIDDCNLQDYHFNNGDIIDCSRNFVFSQIKEESNELDDAEIAFPGTSSDISSGGLIDVKQEDIHEGYGDEPTDGEDLTHESPCRICHYKDRQDKMLLCDECAYFYHCDCFTPPLTTIPDGDWYCPECKNHEYEVVKAGQLLKSGKKRYRAPSSKYTKKWSAGSMATVGRLKSCTKVPSNHFGPIPGVAVGMCWKYRIQISEEGIHRPPVAGIAGKASEGAYSIVLAGGYEDDTDNGDEFLYTGAGGRNLSGNKRTSYQSHDQVLEKTNLAIAVSCAAKLDKENGATAIDWRKGKPIRVVRTEKLGKHSQYAPEEGCRYDGIYKVVKYWPQKGQAGFIIWRYLFRRDDPSPAPWTEEGQALIRQNGYTCIYPEGFFESQAARAKLPTVYSAKGNKGRAKNTDADVKPQLSSIVKVEGAEISPGLSAKRPRNMYTIPQRISDLMAADELNRHLWCIVRQSETRLGFVRAVEQHFRCSFCGGIANQPVTPSCRHNACFACLNQAHKACPTCQRDLNGEALFINVNLQRILTEVFFTGQSSSS